MEENKKEMSDLRGTIAREMVSIVKRLQAGSTRHFVSISLECGSWGAAYEYLIGSRGDEKDVNEFSLTVKDMNRVECSENGKGHLVIAIDTTIVKGENPCP